MKVARVIASAMAIAMGICGAVTVQAEVAWTVTGGKTVVSFDAATLDRMGMSVVVIESTGTSQPTNQAILDIDGASTLTFTERDGVVGSAGQGAIHHADGLALHTQNGVVALDGFAVEAGNGATNAAFTAGDGALEFRNIKLGFDRVAQSLLVEGGEMVISASLAKSLGSPNLAGTVVGAFLMQAHVDWSGGDSPTQFGEVTDEDALGTDPNIGDDGGTGGTACGRPVGADVIVGDLYDLGNYSAVGDIESFSVGTISCNVGDHTLDWIATNNRHPVIGQNMYRHKDNRFELVGISWLKHGFTALTQDTCGCGCNPPGTGALLGIGCSDPYSASLNGSQARLGPRFEVNAHTGVYAYPFTGQGLTGSSIYKRLQVKIPDLDPAQAGGGTYYVEGQYVTPDDSANGNQDNNASYRQVSVSGSGSNWNIFLTAAQTVREEPAIRAWKAADSSVVETDLRVPDEGKLIMAAKVSDLGDGTWHYEYAVQNLNSDRSIGSFSIPVPSGATVENIGFHDVDYHSGEPFDGTDWPGVFSGGAVTWSTADFAGNPNANALRWGTMYNFRFDADVAPAETTATLGLFKPGTPSTLEAVTVGPLGFDDCNSNGVDDLLDISGSTSQDCNGNQVPDECELWVDTTLDTTLVASGLARPVFLTAPAGDFDRLFIVEQNSGQIRIIKDGAVLATPFLNILALISFGGERGLLSMAFHPDYDSNGYFFVNYTNTAGNTVIARYTVSGDPDVADPTSAVVFLTVAQPFANHNGGQLQFGPDGYLYVGMGDGGSAGDPGNRAQDLNQLLGKMLRLDVDAAAPYVPADNPFVGVDGRDEIWAYGVRNPWRFSFDRLTGDMYIADVGQNAWEEVDFQPASSAGGENYGWRCYEGTHAFSLGGCPDPSTMVFPILEYSHAGGACSVTGGYVYRGCEIPDLAGTYFFAEYCAGWIRSFKYSQGDATPPVWEDRTAELGPIVGSIVSFGEDAAGELYILTQSGNVYKIIALDTCGSAAACPDTDVNCDDATDGFDIAVIRNTANWLRVPALADEPRADVNGDNIIDGFDIAAVRNTACWLE